MTLINRTNGGQFALSDLNLAQALAAQASVPIHYAGLQETLEDLPHSFGEFTQKQP